MATQLITGVIPVFHRREFRLRVAPGRRHWPHLRDLCTLHVTVKLWNNMTWSPVTEMTESGDNKSRKLTDRSRRWLAALLFLPAASLSAASHHPLEDIKATVRDFVQSTLPDNRIEYAITMDRLDPRLRLKPCSMPLDAWYPNHGRRAGNLTVGVRCMDDSPWSIYIPVKVNYYEEIAVLARPLQRGAVLTANDIRMERKNISYHTDSYFTDPRAVVGMELVHSLQVGSVISDRNLKEPIIVKRGQQVTLLAQTNNFEVRMNGEAISDGAAGERIRVRNLRSKRVVEGIVKSSEIIYIK